MFHTIASRMKVFLLAATLAGAFLLSACAAPAPASIQASTPVQAAATLEPQPSAVPASAGDPTYHLEPGDLARGGQSETVAAVPASDNNPYWETLPRYARLTLKDYPVTGHLMQPQIFIYPAKDLAAWNEGAGVQVAGLNELLTSHQVGERMPFMPLFNASQVMHLQVSFLNFKSGHGVRYLTQFDQAPLPLNNHELIYTYQGLTSDGKYYVAAVLPVHHASLPPNEMTLPQPAEQFGANFPTYLADMVTQLNREPVSAFTPDLSKLDAMMESLEIK